MEKTCEDTQDHEGRGCLDLIAEAEALFEKIGGQILSAPGFASLLARYEEEILATFSLMNELQTSADCSLCASRSPGGYCGAGIEDWYDVPLLVMNLLLGREIPVDRHHDKCCMFLGETGCRLLSRHHICVNYLCGRIRERLSAPDLARLTAQAGRELFAGWQVEQSLIRTLKTIQETA